MPEEPAIAGGCPLNGGAHLVDRAAVSAIVLAGDQAPIRLHPRLIAPATVEEPGAGFEKTALQEPAERHATLFASCLDPDELRVRKRLNGCDPLARHLKVFRFLLNPEPAPAQTPGDRTGGAAAEKRIQDDLPGFGGGKNYPIEQGLWFLG